jgi:hypothetical protein
MRLGQLQRQSRRAFRASAVLQVSTSELAGCCWAPPALDHLIVTARLTPGRGHFWILKIAHAPSPKNLSKNSSAHKGGSLCVKAFCKKFSGAESISLVAPASAAVRRLAA